MKADTKGLIKFLVGLAWTGVIVWFNATSYPHNPHIHELGFVILFTRGAFGWMPLARSVYPQAPELWSLALSLGVALACAAVVIMVSEQGFPPQVVRYSLLGIQPTFPPLYWPARCLQSS